MTARRSLFVSCALLFLLILTVPALTIPARADEPDCSQAAKLDLASENPLDFPQEIMDRLGTLPRYGDVTQPLCEVMQYLTAGQINPATFNTTPDDLRKRQVLGLMQHATALFKNAQNFSSEQNVKPQLEEIEEVLRSIGMRPEDIGTDDQQLLLLKAAGDLSESIRLLDAALYLDKEEGMKKYVQGAQEFGNEAKTLLRQLFGETFLSGPSKIGPPAPVDMTSPCSAWASAFDPDRDERKK